MNESNRKGQKCGLMTLSASLRLPKDQRMKSSKQKRHQTPK